MHSRRRATQKEMHIMEITSRFSIRFCWRKTLTWNLFCLILDSRFCKISVNLKIEESFPLFRDAMQIERNVNYRNWRYLKILMQSYITLVFFFFRISMSLFRIVYKRRVNKWIVNRLLQTYANTWNWIFFSSKWKKGEKERFSSNNFVNWCRGLARELWEIMVDGVCKIWSIFQKKTTIFRTKFRK